MTARALAALTAGAALLFLALSIVVVGPPWSHTQQLSDVPIYEIYGELTLQHTMPYRDFNVEYPPGALAAFVPPAVVTDSQGPYEVTFAWLMRLCGLGVIVAMGAALYTLGTTERAAITSLGVVAVSPLLLGPLVVQRFDLLPTALLGLAVLAMLRRRDRMSFGLLALSVVTKGFAVVALPLFVGLTLRRSGRREVWMCAGIFAGVLAVVLVPFVLIAPHGMWWTLQEQTSRPLNRETTAGALLLALHQIAGVHLRAVVSHGSGNFVGGVPDALASISVVVELAALVWLWIRCLRSTLTDETFLLGVTAAILAFIVFGKVLSPQYLIWLLALVPLLRLSRYRATVCVGVFSLAMTLTQAYFPRRYFDLYGLDPVVSWIVVVRDLALIGLLVLVVQSLRDATRPEQELAVSA